MSNTITSDYLLLAKDTISDLKKSNPNISNKEMIIAVAPYFEFLNNDEKKEIVFYATATSFMIF